MTTKTPITMILINALRSLSQEELVTLGKAIAERCGHRLEPAICPTNAPALATRGLESVPENHAGDGQPSGLPAAHGSAS